MTGRVPEDGREVKVTTHDVDTRLETVTKRGHRGLGGWWWPALLLVPLLLAGLMSMFTHKSVEDDLSAKAATALAAVNIPNAQVKFSGRDGTITLPAGADKDAAIKAVEGATGVRVANIVTSDAAAATPSATDTASAAPSETASAAPSETASAAPAGNGNDFTISTGADGKTLLIKAVVPDEATKKALLDAVKAANPGVTVTDEITILAGAPALPTEAFTALAGKLKDYPGVSITSVGNKITLTGEVASEELKAAAGAAVATLNPTATVDNQLTVKASTVSADCAAINAKVAAELKAKPVQFAVNSANILPASVTMLNGVAKELKGCLGENGGAAGVNVDGHTDSDGSDALNQTLSQNRANAVKAQLVKAGLDGAKITAKGYGEAKPVADNNTAAGKAQNRRVEIQLV